MMYRSKSYLEFIRSRPCLMCGAPETVAHHEPLGSAGKGIKAPDSHCIPLCAYCHQLAHHIGLKSFWRRHDIKMEIIKLLTKYLEEKQI